MAAKLEKDPFTLVYNALWDLLEDDKTLKSMVRLGNRIRLTGDDRNPIKEKYATEDLPEIIVFPRRILPNTHKGSNFCFIEEELSVEVRTGNVNLVDLYPLKWAVYRASTRWKTFLSSLKWRNLSFVLDVDLISSDDASLTEATTRRLTGWSTLWVFRTRMKFPKNIIIQED